MIFTGEQERGYILQIPFSFLVVFFDNSLLLCVKIMTKSCETSHCQSLLWSSIWTPNSGKTWWRLRPQLGRQREGMAESSDILNLPASVTCALSCPSDYLHTGVVLLQGLPITLCPEPFSLTIPLRVLHTIGECVCCLSNKADYELPCFSSPAAY